MKKLPATILCIAFAMTMAGCSDRPSSKVMNTKPGVKEVIQSRIDEENGATAATETTTETTEETSETSATVSRIGKSIDDLRPSNKGTDGIDFDLTTYSANMVYAEVYNMMYYPREYVGKKIRIQGQFTYAHDDSTGKSYYACFISDAAACCSQGLEFIPSKKLKYPKDFPKVGDKIEVTGTFTTYKEGDNEYVTLKNATFKTVK